MVDEADVQVIERMPRRGVSKRTQFDGDDLGVLSSGLRDAVIACLDEGETVLEVVAGIEDSGLIATDRRLFVAGDGVLVTDPQTGEPAAWPLEWVRRIVLSAGASAGALVLTSQDAADRPIVVVLSRPHLARAESAVASLRDRLAERGNFEQED